MSLFDFYVPSRPVRTDITYPLSLSDALDAARAQVEAGAQTSDYVIFGQTGNEDEYWTQYQWRAGENGPVLSWEAGGVAGGDVKDPESLREKKGAYRLQPPFFGGPISPTDATSAKEAEDAARRKRAAS